MYYFIYSAVLARCERTNEFDSSELVDLGLFIVALRTIIALILGGYKGIKNVI